MSEVHANFQFRPVGQGLFYTGVLSLDEARFTMVYDCGVQPNNSYISEQIDEFVDENNLNDDSAKLDILVISHFHNDHISHVKELLDKTGGAKVVYLPFLSPEEIKVAKIDSRIGGSSEAQQIFLDNPTNVLKEWGAERVVYIHPNGGEGVVEPTNESSGPIRLDEKKMKKVSGGFPDGEEHQDDSGFITIQNFWRIKFFNKERDAARITLFLEAVKELIGIDDFEADDITEYLKKYPKDGFKEFESLYKERFGQYLINDTSLVVFHGPIKEVCNEAHSAVYMYRTSLMGYWARIPWRLFWDSEKENSSLLVGDIRMDDECLNQIAAKWEEEIRHGVIFFQVPHHGSNSYMVDRAFTEFPNSTWQIINYGLGNSYKHPSAKTIDRINAHRGLNHLLFANQVESVRVKYHITLNDE